MNCSCIRGRYDIHTTAYKEAIIYQDFSEWIVDDGIHVFPESYMINLTLPEASKPILLSVKPNDVIRAEDLGKKKIPDGIYCFEVIDCGSKEFEGCCGIKYKKFKLLAPHTECCILHSYATLDRYNEVKDIEEAFHQAQNKVELQMWNEAKKLYGYVLKKLKYLNCNC